MTRIAPAPRNAVFVLVLACVAAAACARSDGSALTEATYVGSFERGTEIVAGRGGRVAAWGLTYGVPARLALYHQDPADPSALEYDAMLPGCNCNARAVTLNDEWIAVSGGEWTGPSGTDYAGFVQLVRTEGPYDAAAILTFPRSLEIDRATASRDRLVAVSGAEIRLFDVTRLAAPVALATFDAGVPSTAIAAAAGGVFVFTENGYVFVDLVAGTFTRTDDPELAGIESAFPYGGKLYVGGRSRIVGFYRVARLDPAGAPALAVEAELADIADADTNGSNVGKMTFDAARGEFVLLDETEPYGIMSQGTSSAVLSFSDGPAITPQPAVKVGRPLCLTTCAMNDFGGPSVHANAGLVYLVPDSTPSDEPVYVFRRP